MALRTTRQPGDTDLDRSIAGAEAEAIVIWRGEPLPFATLPERIAELSGRGERDALYGAYREALEALNPRYEERQRARIDAGDAVASARSDGLDPAALAVDLEPLVLHSETPYYAALRRYLALIDIEQGDATLADVWHVARGEAWSHWFGAAEVHRAAAAIQPEVADVGGQTGWRAAATALAGPRDSPGPVAAAAREARTSVVGDPDWLRGELGVAAAEIPSLVDFIAFVRLWRLRHDIGRLHYELRLYGDADVPAVNRAYYAGIVGHMIGVSVPEEAYLSDVGTPFASARSIETAVVGAQLIEVLENRLGASWWRDDSAGSLMAGFTATATVPDALAYLGYDALDWRPLLRQIRTRLIGEMSGYGGPNITTRAGTRKV
jgi:hypothetical protein